LVSVLRRVYRTTGFVLATAGVVPVHVVHERFVPESERDELKERYKRAWCGRMLRLFGIHLLTLDAVPSMPADRGRLIISNHRSAIDIPLMLHVFGGHMLSRADISGWPLVGTMAERAGTVFVNRSEKSSGAAAIREMSLLLAAKKSVTVFAEGTTFEGDVVHPFHPGGFLAAQRANSEILPVGIAYENGSDSAYRDETFLAHLGRVAGARPSRVALAIGTPLEPQKRARDTADATHAAVTELVKRARSMV
jgi:1-acyl-sn-glycerol-3-phosphate acyltransferase